MIIFYSPSKNACYPEEFKQLYQEANTWPNDVIKITEEEYRVFFLDTQPPGKVRGYDVSSGFKWINSDSLLNPDQIIQMERFWRDSELKRADEELNKVQDSDPNAKGSVADWRNYRKLLRALPDHPSFPSASARPTAPDSV